MDATLGRRFVVGSLITPALARRFRPEVLLAGGLALSSVGYVLLMQIGTHADFALFAAATFIFSFSASPVFTLTNDVILGSAPPERAGAASGISETCAEFWRRVEHRGFREHRCRDLSGRFERCDAPRTFTGSIVLALFAGTSFRPTDFVPPVARRP